MSESDSFIEEVTEEVRRDRLFALMKRYGWIAVLAVLLLVGGAAYNEWRKASARAAAEATGDAMIAALQIEDPAARAQALAAIEPDSAGARAVAALLAAGEMIDAGKTDDAIALLRTVADNADLPLIYRQVATFKMLTAEGRTRPAEERRQGFEALVGPASQLRLLAEEQLAFIDIEEGKRDAALARLREIASDSQATAGLRRRATQLIVALGGDPAGADVGTQGAQGTQAPAAGE